MASLMEAIRKVQRGETMSEAVKFNGRTFKNTKDFKDEDSANAFMQKNKDWGVIGEKGGKVYLAPMKDMGEEFEPELSEAKKQNDGKDLDRVDRDEVKKDFEDREDKDIDNDGDSDESDRYLHKRRKAISKALAKEEKMEDDDEDEDENCDELDEAKQASWKVSIPNFGFATVTAHNEDQAIDRALGKLKVSKQFRSSFKSGVKRKSVKVVKEEVSVSEKVEDMEMGEVIKDFQNSDDPRFKGKSKEKRRAMAIAAKMASKRK